MKLGKNPRLGKAEMSELQTIVANALKMARGEVWSKRRRQTHWQRKEAHDMHREIVSKLKDELKTKLSDMQEKLDKKGKVSKTDLTELKEIHRQQMIKSEEVYTPKQYQELNALYKQALEENQAKDFDLMKFEYDVEQLTQFNNHLEDELEENKEQAYFVEKLWDPDSKSVETNEILYKDLYETEKEENIGLKESISEDNNYIEDLESGFDEIEVNLFGDNKSRQISEILTKVSTLRKMIEKFLSLIEFVKESVPFISNRFSMSDEELIEDATQITELDQNALKDKNIGKDASNIKKDTTSDFPQANKFKKDRP